jgi:hypothetical protein
MGFVITYLLYLVVSIGITVFVGLALSRSGRTFLLDIFGGNDGLAEAVNRLLVVGFYLLNLGFVTLTLRATGEITSARQAVQLLSVKIGEMLLVIGALHFANLVILTRLRRRPRPPVLPFPGGPAGQAGSGVPRPPLAAGGHGKPLQ